MLRILIILLVVSTFAKSEYLSIRKGEKEHKLYSKQINGSNYMLSLDIANNIFPNSDFNSKNNEIINPAYTIKFQPGSLYILMQDWEGQKIIQMGLPAIERNNRTYLPAKDFLYGLDSLEVFTVSSNPDDSYFTLNSKGNTLLQPLEKYKPNKSNRLEPAVVYNKDGNPVLVNLNNSNNPFAETFEKNAEGLADFLNELKPEVEFQRNQKSTPYNEINNSLINGNSIDKKTSNSTSSKKPIKYFLPEELIRKELEEVRSGKK